MKPRPDFTPDVPGPWAVGDAQGNWCIVHRVTGRSKRIGPIGGKWINYFDRAIAEANARNRKETAS